MKSNSYAKVSTAGSDSSAATEEHRSGVARASARIDQVVAAILPACRSTVTRGGFQVLCIRRDRHRLHCDRHGRTWE
jgi:hypothetical protein